MRYIIIMLGLAVAAGGAVATIRGSDTRQSEQLMANLRADPAATINAVEAAVGACVSGLSGSRIGQRFARSLIAPMYLRVIDMRLKGVSGNEYDTQMKAWIVKHHPEVLRLPDKDFVELSGYLKAVGADDVELCMLRSALGPT